MAQNTSAVGRGLLPKVVVPGPVVPLVSVGKVMAGKGASAKSVGMAGAMYARTASNTPTNTAISISHLRQRRRFFGDVSGGVSGGVSGVFSGEFRGEFPDESGTPWGV